MKFHSSLSSIAIKIYEQAFRCDFVNMTWFRRLASVMHAESLLSSKAVSARFPDKANTRVFTMWLISSGGKITALRHNELLASFGNTPAKKFMNTLKLSHTNSWFHLAHWQQFIGARSDGFFKFTKRFFMWTWKFKLIFEKSQDSIRGCSYGWLANEWAAALVTLK